MTTSLPNEKYIEEFYLFKPAQELKAFSTSTMFFSVWVLREQVGTQLLI